MGGTSTRARINFNSFKDDTVNSVIYINNKIFLKT